MTSHLKKKEKSSVYPGSVIPYGKNQVELSSSYPYKKGQVETSSSAHACEAPSLTQVTHLAPVYSRVSGPHYN